MTVTIYLKGVRLDAAYRDLIAANPSRDTVTAIALRNGCGHVGRFSSEFRERFGQLPRETLRSEPSAFGRLREVARRPLCPVNSCNAQLDLSNHRQAPQVRLECSWEQGM